MLLLRAFFIFVKYSHYIKQNKQNIDHNASVYIILGSSYCDSYKRTCTINIMQVVHQNRPNVVVNRNSICYPSNRTHLWNGHSRGRLAIQFCNFSNMFCSFYLQSVKCVFNLHVSNGLLSCYRNDLLLRNNYSCEYLYTLCTVFEFNLKNMKLCRVHLNYTWRYRRKKNSELCGSFPNKYTHQITLAQEQQY